jgi:hypothetical protein
MATIYYKNDNSPQLISQLGNQLSNLFYESKTRGDYYKEIDKIFNEEKHRLNSRVDETREVEKIIPSEWKSTKTMNPEFNFQQYANMSANGVQAPPVNQMREQNMPTRFDNQIVNEVTGSRELNPMERQAIIEDTRAKIAVANAKVPREMRIDPWDRSNQEDVTGGVRGGGSPIPGAALWRGFNKETGEPVLGAVLRSRSKPTDGKYKGTDIIWDVEKGTEGYYGAVSSRESKQVETSKDLQQLFNNYKNDKTADNFRELNRAYNVQGKELVKQDSTTYEKVAKTFGFGKDKPEFLLKDLKTGSYTAVNAQGEEFDFKKDKYTPGKVYKDAEGKKAKYLGNGKWQTM